jgi:predicted nuclease of predicted toxin-antitoxin system
LADLFPGSRHVRQVGLSRADDSEVWHHGLENKFAIVSKDSDFHQRSFTSLHVCKVIWIRLGNCSTHQVERLLRDRCADIRRFLNDPEATFLALG